MTLRIPITAGASPRPQLRKPALQHVATVQERAPRFQAESPSGRAPGRVCYPSRMLNRRCSCGVTLWRRWRCSAAVSCGAQELPEQAFKAFARGFLTYAPASVFTLTENTTGATPVGPYQAVRVERTSHRPDAKDQVGMLVDLKTRMVAAGLLFPLPAVDPPVTAATLPLFVQQHLAAGARHLAQQQGEDPVADEPDAARRRWSPLTAEVATGYGSMHMPLAISADGKYLALGGTWPLDRDPRAVRREILESQRHPVGPRAREGAASRSSSSPTSSARPASAGGARSSRCWRSSATRSATGSSTSRCSTPTRGRSGPRSPASASASCGPTSSSRSRRSSTASRTR